MMPGMNPQMIQMQMMAQQGKKVLLIDADLRHSGLNDLLSMDERPTGGLSSILSGQNDFGSAIVPVTEHGFDLMPTGHKPPDPAELLSGPRLSEVVKMARIA